MLAETILRLTDNQDLRRKIGEAARKRQEMHGEEIQILLNLAAERGILGKGTVDCHPGI